MTLLLWLGLSVAAAGDDGCQLEEWVSPQQLQDEVKLALVSLDEGDRKGFLVGYEAVQLKLPCVNGRLNQDQVAEIHLVHALALQQLGDGTAQGHFWGALLLEPDLQEAYEQLHGLWPDFGERGARRARNDPDLEELPVNAGGIVFIDGLAGHEYPINRPWVYQYQDPNDRVEGATMVSNGGDLPSGYPRLRPRLAAIAFATGGSAVIMFGVGQGLRQLIQRDYLLTIEDPDHAPSNSQAIWRSQQASMAVSGVLTVVAVGTLVRLVRVSR